MMRGYQWPPRSLRSEAGPHESEETGLESNRYEYHQQLLEELRRRFHHEWKPLEQALRRRHRRPRADLAFARVVSPLMDHRDSGKIERSVDEFTDDELRVFIRAGVRRECLLLARAPDIERAQETRATKRKHSNRRPGARDQDEFDDRVAGVSDEFEELMARSRRATAAKRR